MRIRIEADPSVPFVQQVRLRSNTPRRPEIQRLMLYSTNRTTVQSITAQISREGSDGEITSIRTQAPPSIRNEIQAVTLWSQAYIGGMFKLEMLGQNTIHLYSYSTSVDFENALEMLDTVGKV